MRDEKIIDNELQGKYEIEMQELIDIANNKFGSDFFERLEELSKDYNKEYKPENYKYSLKVSSIGAFHAG